MGQPIRIDSSLSLSSNFLSTIHISLFTKKKYRSFILEFFLSLILSLSHLILGLLVFHKGCTFLLLSLIHSFRCMPSTFHHHNQNKMGIEDIYELLLLFLLVSLQSVGLRISLIYLGIESSFEEKKKLRVCFRYFQVPYSCLFTFEDY